MIYEQFLSQFTDYKPFTTFWQDFSIAEQFGEKEIHDTFERSFKEWKKDYKYLTELVMVLNHKLWQHHQIPGHTRLCELYGALFEKANTYAYNHLDGDEFEYFYKTTD